MGVHTGPVKTHRGIRKHLPQRRPIIIMASVIALRPSRLACAGTACGSTACSGMRPVAQVEGDRNARRGVVFRRCVAFTHTHRLHAMAKPRREQEQLSSAWLVAETILKRRARSTWVVGHKGA